KGCGVTGEVRPRTRPGRAGTLFPGDERPLLKGRRQGSGSPRRKGVRLVLSPQRKVYGVYLSLLPKTIYAKSCLDNLLGSVIERMCVLRGTPPEHLTSKRQSPARGRRIDRLFCVGLFRLQGATWRNTRWIQVSRSRPHRTRSPMRRRSGWR